MAALLPPQGANFNAIFCGQKELDANFDALLEEYDDGNIGEGEEDVEVTD